ncbi:MAG: lipocalin family protein [Gemmatimonadaceae bacterium]
MLRILSQAAIALLAGVAMSTAQQPGGEVHAVPSVDLNRYVGRWYEIARLPNRFQKDCARETTAEYEKLSDTELRVVNTCTRADGSSIRAEGKGRLADKNGPTSKLKVRFAPAFLSFLPMVWGDYWVLDLAPDYSVSLVGDPKREYLWILSRTPTLDDATYQRVVDAAAAQGFDVSKLVKTPQG